MSYKYIVVATPPAKPSITWDYQRDYFPRRMNYKADADSLASKARRKGGQHVAVQPYTEHTYTSARAAVAKAQL